MEFNIDHKIPLGELLGVLKSSGYEVSVERIIEIQSVLLSSPVSRLKLGDLKFILTPILARNEEDQKNIYKIIDSFIAKKIQKAKKKPVGLKAWLQKRQLVFGIKMAGFLVVAASAILFYFLQIKESGKNSYVNSSSKQIRVTTDRGKSGKTNPVRDTNNLKAKLPDIRQASVGQPEYNGKPIRATRLDIILQISGAFGLGLGAILFYLLVYEKRKKMEMENKAKNEKMPFPKEKTSTYQNTEEQFEQVALQFPENNFLIQRTIEFRSIRTNLKKPGFTANAKIDVKASALATAKNAGFSSLVFDNQSLERKYLLLVDNNQPGAHITHLLNFIVRFITASKVPHLQYVYTTNICELREGGRKIATLQDLSCLFTDYHLIIIGDTRSFLNDDDSFTKKEILDLLKKWPSRSVITPLSFVDWSHREAELQNEDFNIVPAEIKAIELLTECIAEDSSAKEELVNCFRDKYPAPGIDFSSVQAVKEYLNNEELFQLVCSLAVYPRLNWSVTLALFAAILKKRSGLNHAVKINYDTLLNFARIPWLQATKLDPSIRLELFNRLEPATEVIARETILQLLQEIQSSTTPGSPASRELQIQYKLNTFFLFAHDPQQYREYRGVNQEIMAYWKNLDEWALKEHINSRGSALMPVNHKGESTTIEEFVLKEEEFEKRNLNFLKLVLLTAPAMVLYLLLSVFRPAFIYLDQYNDVSFHAIIKKNDVCKEKLAQAVIHSKTLDTIQLKSENEADTLFINNAEYNHEISISLLSADGTNSELSVNARDSMVSIPVTCN